MSGFTKTERGGGSASVIASDSARQDLLLEQIGKTTAVQKDSVFVVNLPVGGSEPAINPLPDYE